LCAVGVELTDGCAAAAAAAVAVIAVDEADEDDDDEDEDDVDEDEGELLLVACCQNSPLLFSVRNELKSICWLCV
jgi:hypothetical protein